MTKNGILMLIGFGVMTAMQAQGARVAGSGPKEWPANPKKHVISITREAADDAGKRAIDVAEKARPDSGSWWIKKDGQAVLTYRVKTPHAITRGALDYYSALIRVFQKKTWNAYSEPRSSLTYKAVAAHHDIFTLNGKEYRNVHVVKMEMSFSIAFVYSDGGTSFEKTRTVVVDDKGVPQAIDGDKDERFPEWA